MFYRTGAPAAFALFAFFANRADLGMTPSVIRCSGQIMCCLAFLLRLLALASQASLVYFSFVLFSLTSLSVVSLGFMRIFSLIVCVCVCVRVCVCRSCYFGSGGGDTTCAQPLRVGLGRF